MNKAVFDILKELPLLKSIDNARWEVLIPQINFRKLAPEETLFHSGVKSEKLHLILKGSLNLYLPESKTHKEVLVGVRKKQDTAGDFAVLNGGEHLVTARAASHSLVASIPASGLEKLGDLDPKILAHVYDTAAKLSQRILLIKSFLNLFGSITDLMIKNLLSGTKIRHLRSGEELFSQGDKADGLYIVMAGSLPITVTDENGHSRLIATISAPQMVGEFSLITDSPRNASVHASRESMVAFLSKDLFNQYIMQKPKLLASISRMIVERQHLFEKNLSNTTIEKQHIALFFISPQTPSRQFVQQLKKQIRKTSGQTLAIDSKLFNTLYGKDNASQTRFSDHFNSSITAWLDDRESRYEHVLYVCDKHWSSWTHRCLNRSDKIIVILESTSPKKIQPLELKLNEMFYSRQHRPQIEYVFLHPDNTDQPSNTAKWLKARSMDSFHHIRCCDTNHYARLARRLSGYATGLVLSGGGARGYVHLGVYKALQENNIPIDYIGGSSMGALLGATIANGLNYKQIYQLSEEFANPRALFDYTLPVSALMKSAKLSKFCKKVFEETRIEDLWIPYFCISSNLSLGKEHCHKQGLLWKAVRSSIAIPGVFTPVPQKNGELHVDGAVLNTFPVSHLIRELQGGKIIGVNISQIEALEYNYNYGSDISGWKVFATKINPFKKNVKVPFIVETLLRANDIKSVESMNLSRKQVDILIEPDVNSFSLLDFRSFLEISEIGYTCAMEAFSSDIR